jgi:hypothetical protein
MFNKVNVLSILIDRAATLKTGPVIIGERSGKPQPLVDCQITLLANPVFFSHFM